MVSVRARARVLAPVPDREQGRYGRRERHKETVALGEEVVDFRLAHGMNLNSLLLTLLGVCGKGEVFTLFSSSRLQSDT